jgi:ABC-type cobalamin/Fe3+-siderophores transport system ATPase subunit
VIETQRLTKVYGDKTAVDDSSFTVRPGVVTGFLGPNAAGKSTTMRAIVGPDRPTWGQALVQGRRYANHRAPLCVVGALLEAGAAHPGRSAIVSVNTAGAVFALLAVLYAVPTFAVLRPPAVAANVVPFLPARAGLVVYAGYAVLTLAAAALLLKRRDA